MAAVLPLQLLLVEQVGVFQEPLGLIEVGWQAGPVLVIGLEPDGPFAGLLPGEKAW